MTRAGRAVLAVLLLLPLVAVAAWVGVRARRVREDPRAVLEALRAQAGPALPEAAAAGAAARTAVERYDAGNLVDWVDGGAEAMLRAGFSEARVATYTFPDGTEAEVAGVAFASAEAARAWLDGQRPPGARPLDEEGAAWVAADVAGATRGRVALRALVMVSGDDPEPALEALVRAWRGGGGSDG